MAKATREPPPGALDVLDDYHNQASRSSVLTTFDDLTAPPAPSVAGDGKGIELVQGGLSSLYSRIKASVGVKDNAGTDPVADNAGGKIKGVSRSSTQTTKSPAGTTVSSPIVVSVPSSRLQSPLATHFPDSQLPPSRDSTASGSVISNKTSLNGSRSSLATMRSRPSVAPSMEATKEHTDDAPSVQNPGLPQPGADISSKHAPVSRDIPPSRGRDEPFRRHASLVELEDESDTTEDDMVVVDGGGFANDNARFAFTADSMQEGLAKIASRDSHYKVALGNGAKTPRDFSDNSSEHTEIPRIATSAQTPVLAPAPKRPPLVQVGPSHLPGYRPSRASSSDGLSSIITSTTATARSPAIAPIDELKQHTSANATAATLPSSTLSHMRRKILDREFWMRDENAKDCFNCGDSFSTFRRKHHCRTCGQIFDSKCTSLVTGKVFGQSGTLRVCKPCEAIIYGNDDDSSVYTDEGDQASIYEHEENFKGMPTDDFDPSESDHTKIGTPTISIPMSRKVGSEKKRRSAVIEVAAPILPRPSSSRSLRSLSGRPRSSSHKRHHSRHQHMRNVRYDDRAPFHQQDLEGVRSRSALPAFHHDNIIDPDLAPFMSDEDSSEEEQTSIFAALRGDAHMDPERGGIQGLLSAMRKGKSRAGDRSVASGHARDTDNISITSRQTNRHAHSRMRNLSISSVAHARPSPRRSKSNSLLRALGPNLVPNLLPNPSPSPQPITSPPHSGSRITRSASMQGGNAPAVELNQASLQHVRKLLKQMLQEGNIRHASSWEKALMPILLQCTDDVNPDVQRNDDMDIRHYIKLKKIPGGRPKDTSYVSGVVFTKQVAKKDMLRNIPSPRLIIVTFAIEYARHQTHFMSLDPVIAQEREYLRNLVSRIAALHPSVLLVQRNVSGLALEFLQEAGIVVAYNVKPTVLNAVSRCTQTPMITSVDKLAIDPNNLGHCESFDVKTYVNEGVKKTYIFLSGSQPELGCTIVLRGADTATLRRLKRITEFMCYVVYNLKLETCLMRDEFVLIPSTSIGGTLNSNPSADEVAQTSLEQSTAATGEVSVPITSDTSALNITGGTERAPPEVDPLENLPAPSFYSDMVEKHRTTILSASPFVKFAQPYLLNQAREHEAKLSRLKKLRDQYSSEESEKTGETPQKFELVQPEMVNIMVERTSKQVREFLHAVHAAQYDKALHNYQTQKRQWEAFLLGNMDLFNPHNHQKIATLYSVVNSNTSTPCVGPEIIAMGFYHEHEFDDGFTPDCTLGQYVEDLIQTAHVVCDSDGCNRRMFDHHRQYVHGHGQISVHVFKYPSKIKNMHNTILMWSVCRLCGQETQVMPMSANTWKYSFAKYLELTFWSTALHPRAHVCPHDIHKDHVRYFGMNNIALRIQYDPVPLYEVIVPRPVITWKVDGDLKLKNEQFLKIEERLDRFMASVRTRLKSIRVDSVIPEKVEICRVEVDKLTKRANEEHDWLKQKLQDKYMSSKYYEIIPMNRAIRAIQEKAVAWDDVFTNFEQEFFPSEKDIRRLAALQLKRIFLERDESTSSLTSVEEGAESVEEEPAMNERGELPGLSDMTSSMSEERARDMLHEVVEEDHSHGAQVDAALHSEESPVTPTGTQPSSSQTLPIQTPIGALEREDVRHLDLAVSSNFPEGSSPVPKGDNLLKTPSNSTDSSNDLDPGSPTPTAHPRINPIDKSVAEAINNMPASPTPAQTMTLESRIPRLVETIRRDSATRPAAMVRTQSQPQGIPKLQPAQPSPSNSTLGSSNSSNGDYPKFTLSESARALEKRMSERLNLGAFRQTLSSSKIPIPRSIPAKRQQEATKVSALAKHFEQLQREFEKERKRERLQQQRQNRQARAYPVASSKPIVEVYKDVHEAVQEHSPSDEDAQPSPARISTDNSTLGDSSYTEATTTTATTTTDTSPVDERHPKGAIVHSHSHEGSVGDQPPSVSHPTSDVEGEGSDIEATPEDIPLPDSIASSQLLDSQLEASLELPKHEKTTLMRMLTSFWSERSASGWAPLDYPLSQNEHVWEDSDIIVREDEPSSIIALALSSPDYLAKLQTFRDDPTVAANGVGGLEASETSIERNLLHEANTNIRYSFTNRGVKAQCKIFYAQSFDALRRKCGVADRVVESLSRCTKWDSKGGKSKSLFLKTLDERFVVKSLSAIEVNAFFRFAPNYFAFTHQNLFKGLPSVIAKMFGLFQVQIRTPGGKDFDWFMLVMENLFYEREPNRRYDLKGSMRNRKVQSTGERDEVLLDENLVDIIYSETPIFVREHTKKLLKASVWNDTLFLQQQNVMDYSLMAGFHDEGREIIVGIIDCIRTYTWDKKLESWIKDRGKNKPTITSPKDYRNRFRMAMEKYILQAPNCWHQFSGRVVGVGGVGPVSVSGPGPFGGTLGHGNGSGREANFYGGAGAGGYARDVGVNPPMRENSDAKGELRRTIVLASAQGGQGGQVLEVEGGEEEKAAGSRI